MNTSWDVARIKLENLAKTRGFKADLARRMGMGKSALQNYFDNNRTPGLDMIDKIAAALGVQAWELIKPSNAWPTIPKKLSTIGHLEAALEILRNEEKIRFYHNAPKDE